MTVTFFSSEAGLDTDLACLLFFAAGAVFLAALAVSDAFFAVMFFRLTRFDFKISQTANAEKCRE
ncbi:MAG: hypothetical protein IKZ33_08430 [Lentisphaeria bacterium]|nr:hypothetical protein [Lentisphaeria bacterium]